MPRSRREVSLFIKAEGKRERERERERESRGEGPRFIADAIRLLVETPHQDSTPLPSPSLVRSTRDARLRRPELFPSLVRNRRSNYVSSARVTRNIQIIPAPEHRRPNENVCK